jgi:Tol biopolymer transport system component
MKHLLFLLISFSVFCQSPKEKIQVTDLLKIKTAGRPQVSPKGSQFIYTVTSIVDDPEKKGDFVYQTHLHLGNLITGETRALTSGKNSISSPSWNPDGTKISFTRDMGTKSQVMCLIWQEGNRKLLLVYHFQYPILSGLLQVKKFIFKPRLR